MGGDSAADGMAPRALVGDVEVIASRSPHGFLTPHGRLTMPREDQTQDAASVLTFSRFLGEIESPQRENAMGGTAAMPAPLHPSLSRYVSIYLENREIVRNLGITGVFASRLP